MNVLISASRGEMDIATPLVHAVFECVRSRGHEMEIGNLEIVLNAIKNIKMIHLVKFLKSAKDSNETSILDAEPSTEEIKTWQKVAYQIEEITPDDVLQLQ